MGIRIFSTKAKEIFLSCFLENYFFGTSYENEKKNHIKMKKKSYTVIRIIDLSLYAQYKAIFVLIPNSSSYQLKHALFFDLVFQFNFLGNPPSSILILIFQFNLFQNPPSYQLKHLLIFVFFPLNLTYSETPTNFLLKHPLSFDVLFFNFTYSETPTVILTEEPTQF